MAKMIRVENPKNCRYHGEYYYNEKYYDSICLKSERKHPDDMRKCFNEFPEDCPLEDVPEDDWVARALGIIQCKAEEDIDSNVLCEIRKGDGK